MPGPNETVEFEKLKATVARLQKQVVTLEGRLTEMIAKRDSAEKSLSKALSEKQVLTAEYRSKVESMSATIERQTRDIQKLTAENKQIQILDKSIAILKGRIVELEKAIKDKDAHIKSFSGKCIDLTNEKAALDDTIKKKNSQIYKLNSDVVTVNKLIEEQKKHYENILSEKTKKNERLEEKLSELREDSDLDKDLIKDHEKIKLQYKILLLQSEARESEYIKLSGELKALKDTYTFLEKENKTNQGLLLQEQQEKSKLKQELNVLTKKLKSAFSMEDLSQYCKSSIDNFNNLELTSNETVNYIIGEMDVDLKADLGKTDTGGMVLSSPGFLTDTEHGLSNIRFTIRAVPKLTED